MNTLRLRLVAAGALALLVRPRHGPNPADAFRPAGLAALGARGDRRSRAEYLGRKCLLLDGGAAIAEGLRDARRRRSTWTSRRPRRRGFFGIQFRIADDGANAEWVYLRQHKSGLPDAMQYTPVLNTGLNWQIYNGPGLHRRRRHPEETSGSTCASR